MGRKQMFVSCVFWFVYVNVCGSWASSLWLPPSLDDAGSALFREGKIHLSIN